MKIVFVLIIFVATVGRDLLLKRINIKELYKIKIARPGFGWLRKIVQGWKPSGDPKLNKGVDIYMDVNREKTNIIRLSKSIKQKIFCMRNTSR